MAHFSYPLVTAVVLERTCGGDLLETVPPPDTPAPPPREDAAEIRAVVPDPWSARLVSPLLTALGSLRRRRAG
jgi:hypothetical protein